MEIIDISVEKNMRLLLDRMEKYNKINDIINLITPSAIDKNDFDLLLKMENRRKENISNQLSCLEDMIENDIGMKEVNILFIYNALKRKNDECDRVINLAERTIKVL